MDKCISKKYTISDLKNNVDKCSNVENAKLFFDNKCICDSNIITTFYTDIIEYLYNNYSDTFSENKPIQVHSTGDDKYYKPIVINGENLKIYIQERTSEKFKKLIKCFEKLKVSEQDKYRFEITIKSSNSNDNGGDEEVKRDVNIKDIISNIITKNNKQVIFTGAPGTGKTWAVKSFVEEKQKEGFDTYKFVQFHSSYDYTDFVEGLRPVPANEGGNMFVRMDGIFKAFCRKIVKENLEKLSEKNEEMTIEGYFENMKNPDYRERIYKKLSERPYYFIIDEINRADLSRVFGELMYGLEESYREIHNRFDTQYKNLPTYEMRGDKVDIIADDCFKDGFFVPYNLHIIGTMNDIDRSVESFDFALRRRFIWKDIKANKIMTESLKSMRDKKKDKNLSDDKIVEISNKICQMNNKITEFGYGLSEAYHIGPAYFKDLVKESDEKTEGVLSDIFENRIEPILCEYMRGRKAEVQDKLISSCRDELLGKKDEKN